MYSQVITNKFYNLNEDPFFDSIDSKYIYLSEKHLEGFSSLKYAGEHGKGFLLLTGEPGTGKTSIVRKLLTEIDDTVIVANITNPRLDLIDFFNVVLDEFGLNTVIESKREFWAVFKKFLDKAYKDRKNVLLIIDEAHEIPAHLYEEIRLLTNVDTRSYNMLNIFFVGQTVFRDILSEPQNNSLRQRIYINYYLEPLSKDESVNLINHRLHCAGAKRIPFSSEALNAIYQYTQGYPRIIVELCQRSLLKGSARSVELIEKNIINEASKDMDFGVIAPRRKHIDYQNERSGSEYIAEERDQFGLSMITSKLTNKISTQQFEKLAGLKKWPFALASATLLVAIIAIGIYLLGGDSKSEVPVLAKNENSVTGEINNTIANSQHQSPKNSIDEISQKEIGMEASQNTSADKMISASGVDEGQNAGSVLETSPDSAEKKSIIQKVENEAEIKPDDENYLYASKIPQKIAMQNGIQQADRTDQSINSSNSTTTVGNDIKNAKKTISSGSEKATSPMKQTTVEKFEPIPKKSLQIEKKSEQSTKGKIDAVDEKDSDTFRAAQTNKSKPRITSTTSDIATTEVFQKDASQLSRTNIETPQKADNEAQEIEAKKAPLQVEKEILRPENLKIETAKVLEKNSIAISLNERIISFLDKYCLTYESKQLDKFVQFFSNDAIENGKPLSSLIPKYRRNFEAIETIRYHIAIDNFSHEKVSDKVKIEGNFFLRWKPYNYDWRENSGKIFMDLQKDDDSFKVSKLKYYSTRSKK